MRKILTTLLAVSLFISLASFAQATISTGWSSPSSSSGFIYPNKINNVTQNVSIGKSTNDYGRNLEVTGTMELGSAAGGGSLYILDDGEATSAFISGVASNYILQNLGVGTTTPGTKLGVSGSGVFGNYVNASYFTGTSTATSTFAGSVAIGPTVFATPTNHAFAFGNVVDISGLNNPRILSSSAGSLAGGDALDHSITATGAGSIALGYANTGDVIASAAGAVAIGDNVSATAANSFAIGKGFTNSTTNTLMFGMGATPSWVLSVTNNGVATTAPSARLAVKSGGTGTGRAFVVSDSSNNERLTLLDNGNTGFGKVNPTVPLDVSITSTAGVGTQIAGFGSSAAQRIQLFDENTGSGLGGKIYFNAGNPGVIDGAGNLNISNSGAVINTLGTLRAQGPVDQAAQSIDRIDIGVQAGTPRMVFEDSGNTIWQIDNAGGTFRWFKPNVLATQLSFSSDDAQQSWYGQTNVELIRLNTNGVSFFNGGNVGIGTTTPTVTLDVNGGYRGAVTSTSTGFTCSATLEGESVYNLTNHHLWLCMGSEPWALLK